MYHYEYVTRKEAGSIKQKIEETIHQVQDNVREEFTFEYDFVGSSARNMVTCDFSQNKGFDFDVNISVNDPENEFTPKELKEKLMNAFNTVINGNQIFLFNSCCENSTRVFTVKQKDRYSSKIIYSADFCVVNQYYDDNNNLREEYIRFNKTANVYTWEKQSKSFVGLNSKVEKLKNQKLWDEVRDIYIYKKNHNADVDKKSRSLFAEAVNEVFRKYIKSEDSIIVQP